MLTIYDQMFMVAAHIIETYSGKTYTSFVEDRIFTPLGMSSSTFSPEKAGKTGKFTQGWTKNGRLIPEWFPEDMAILMAGPGGVISSAVDMVGTFHHHYLHRLIVSLVEMDCIVA
jgi:CubicO group peptidase (beta-lactamase class C family)